MAREISQGMWCVDGDGRIGIASVDSFRQIDDTVKHVNTFHLVDANGETTLVVDGWANLRQAKLDEIPSARRPTDESQITRLKYA